MAILDPQEIDQVLDGETPVFPTAEGDGPRLARVGAGLVRDMRQRGVLPSAWVYASGTVMRDLVVLVLSEDTTSIDRRKAFEAALVIHAYVTATLRAWLEGRRRERSLEDQAKDPQRRHDHRHEDDEDASRVDRVCEAMNSLLRRLAGGAQVDAAVRRRAQQAIFGMITETDLVTAAVEALAEASGVPPVKTVPDVAVPQQPEATKAVAPEENGGPACAFVLTWTQPDGPFKILDSGETLELSGLGLDPKTKAPFPTLIWFAWLVLKAMEKEVALVPCPGRTTRFDFQRELQKRSRVWIANASSNDRTQHALVGDIRFDRATERVARAWIAAAAAAPKPDGGPRRS